MELKTNIIRVIAAVVDQQQLTLYKETGETVVILQGDPRLATIIKTITPVLATGNGAIAEVDIGTGKLENPYSEFENLFGKAIQFFKLDRGKLAGLLNTAVAVISEALAEPLPAAASVAMPMSLGQVPKVGSGYPLNPGHSIFAERTPVHQPLVVEEDDQEENEASTKAAHLLKVTEEIIAHAQPVSHPEFDDKDVGSNNTIVAVVGGKVVGDIEKLKPQIARAVQTNSAKGLQSFMTRVAAVADKRRHSVEDLLKFLERGDLPIAEDGSIIIYKVLRFKDQTKGTYVDCHSGKVTQRVGSYVTMNEAMVDPNRRNECSYGLHVARRAYVGGFSGDVCVLAKVHPEDVIAVPDHDANKMRVCGYHILFELSDEAFQKLKYNKPFTDNGEAQLLLGRALAGDHDQPIEVVKITGQKGEGVQILPVIEGKLSKKAIPAQPATKAEVKPTEALADETSGIDLSAPKVDPKKVNAEVKAAKAEAESRRDKAQRLYKAFKTTRNGNGQKAAAQELAEHKKATKLGWEALGIPESAVKAILQQLS